MRKLTGLLGAAAMLSIVPATPALAEGSIVQDGGICYGFIPTVDGQFQEPVISTTDSHFVKKGSWATLSCHFDIPSHLLPPKGVKADNVPCTILGYGETTNTRMSASPGGRAVGTCRFRS